MQNARITRLILCLWQIQIVLEKLISQTVDIKATLGILNKEGVPAWPLAFQILY